MKVLSLDNYYRTCYRVTGKESREEEGLFEKVDADMRDDAMILL